MIKIQRATLRVKKIQQSKNGPFAVANLFTEIGEFKVKDVLLDQFDEGEYQCTVWISEIYLGQYIAWGRAVAEVRAKLHDIRVDSASELDKASQEPPEPDPIDEVEPPRATRKLERPVQQPAPKPPKDAGNEGAPGGLADLKAKLQGIGRKAKPEPELTAEAKLAVDFVALYGEELWSRIERREPVKLDPTADRAVFRQQAATLRQQLSYEFDPLQQTFNPVP
nr:DUF3275 family protein [Variovorax boronicumulans]